MAVTLTSFPAKYRAAFGDPIVFIFTNDLPDLLPFKIFAGLPVTHPNASAFPYVEVGQVDGNMGPDGYIRVQVNAFLQPVFKNLFPDAGFNGYDIRAYYIQYGNEDYDQLTQVRWALNASENPDVISRQPVWTDTGNKRCVKVDMEDVGSDNTGEQEKEQKDENPCSLTYNTLRWISNGANMEDCPVPDPPVDATPNPQFSGTVVCDQSPVRTSSTGKRRKRDLNPDSPTYMQWLKPDTTYSPTEADGQLFSVGDQPGSCPLGAFFKIVNTYTPGSPGTEYQSTVTLYADSAGTTPINSPETISFNFSGGVTGTIYMGSNTVTVYNGAGGSFLTFNSVSPSYYTQIF